MHDSLARDPARADGAQVTQDLHELRTSARIPVNEQRELVARLERYLRERTLAS